ncbi:unnamed protein product [Hermetia illucens]|uniref:Tudor domain-containing protein n=2 Tax=Hermetia illucens TaxID=343691 RepID=A0A7R8UAN9_HERIL|nr:A-kinase anchor protein 1, mitochondrial isoform X2 [Hermetia illucens]XP_037909186.1 A-kinase anchor protein 1, mitochondrial isoform X2 [Hermetia illucens]CAD7077282.1 unnamed protein product [Hermetia illucens]
MVSSRPLLFLSIPGLALMLGVIWYRRRKTVHCDDSAIDGEEPSLEANISSDDIKTNNNRSLKSSKSLEIMSSKGKNGDNTDSSKYGKSAPIDIQSNRKKTPVYLTDKQIDTEILKIKIRDSEYKTLRSIEESCESISPLSLPDSVSKRNFLSPRPKRNEQRVEPVVIKATSSAKISPKDSFLESAYTEDCPLQAAIKNNSNESVKPDTKKEKIEEKATDKLGKREKVEEPLALKVESRPQTTASPPLSVCSLHSADSGKGSSLPHAEEQSIMNYEFLLPDSLVGQLYGRKRAHINQLRAKTGAKISLKKHPFTDKIKICVIEGTQKQISSALSLIRQKLPSKRYPNLTLERVHFAEPQAIVPLNEVHRSCLELALIEGINNDVIVTSVISGGHLFVQQPLHPSHPTLSILQNCLNKTYSNGEAPGLPEMTDDAICVGNYLDSWYRVQIVSKTVEEDDSGCLVKFLDYGGYAVLERDNLKQIRADFLVTPFQAIEAVLSNIVPPGAEWSTEAATILYELTKGIVLQAQVVGYTSENIPEIYLYACLGPNNVIFINKELVARKLANWTELRN